MGWGMRSDIIPHNFRISVEAFLCCPAASRTEGIAGLGLRFLATPRRERVDAVCLKPYAYVVR